MLLNIDSIHILVTIEWEWKAGDRFGTVGECVVVAERLAIELMTNVVNFDR
ncbi:hypothetical protein FP2506_16764 [Fulvimarina pelagi HTCC2506]|uniref:Uncharacterized protein n=1 Tax=Fulvimarina pelagi HTCC2506 TaxID=314231 RepID=Q0G2S7_9HYPH|nr:hypothetical protein FP2506_16764 [Fulvimarina pelagi HTCC2506]